MRIALIGPSIFQQGGVASVLKGLAQYLQNRCQEVVLVSTTGASSSLAALWTFLRAIFTVIRNCLPGGADVFHFHMSSRGSCLRKSILALICMTFRRQLWVRCLFRRAAVVIALSNSWRDWIDANIRCVRTEVVFNGVDNSLYGKSKSGGINTILFLGRIGKRKGTSELIAAVRKISSIVPNLVLEIGGDGDLARYQKEASDLSNVHFLGWIDEAARAEALRRATVFCLPSWHEGLPMSILEAMSAGLPVVSTPVGGIPEAVISGETGLLVEPGNSDALSEALLTILSDSALGEEMGRKGRILQQQSFSSESMGSRCLALYRRCEEKHTSISR